MTPGDIVLIGLPQFGVGSPKLRPALVIAILPGPYQNLLLCGISTQLHQIQPNWDETVQPSDSDFVASGLHQASGVRLSYLYAADPNEVTGVIGRLDATRVARLRQRLADHLKPQPKLRIG